MTDLITFGRSWSYPAELSLKGSDFLSKGYITSQRCYQLENKGRKASKIELSLKGSKESPIINPAIQVKNWNSNKAKILVNGKEYKESIIGINHELGGEDLVLFIPVRNYSNMEISIIS